MNGESPDFDQIADDMATIADSRIMVRRRFAEQLRLVWNARGAADIYQVNASLLGGNVPKLVDALRSLDK